MGLKPNFMTEAVLVNMLERIIKHKDGISHDRIMPRVKWNK